MMEKKNITLKNKISRLAWNIVYVTFFRYSPVLFHSWRRFLLRLFGAKLAKSSVVYPSVKIWHPMNLKMKEGSCLGPEVICYNVDKISIGKNSTVSQMTHLCTASHKFDDESIFKSPEMILITAPIVIKDYVWITAEVFIAPGVILNDGSVVYARSVVTKDLDDWSIYSGFPAKKIRPRIIRK